MSSPVDSPPPELAGRRILIVDDDRLNVRILTTILEGDGYEIHAANQPKNRLLGTVAHDLRNPLACIRGLADFRSNGTVGPITTDPLDLME